MTIESRTGQPNLKDQFDNCMQGSTSRGDQFSRAKKMLHEQPSVEGFFGILRIMRDRYATDWFTASPDYENWKRGYVARRKKEAASGTLERAGINPEQPLPASCLIVETLGSNPQLTYPAVMRDTLISDLQQYLYPREQFEETTDGVTASSRYLKTRITEWAKNTQTDEPYSDTKRTGFILRKASNGGYQIQGRGSEFDTEEFAFFSGKSHALSYESMSVAYIVSPPEMQRNDTARVTVKVPVEAVVADLRRMFPITATDVELIETPVTGHLGGRAMKQSLEETPIVETDDFRLTGFPTNGSIFQGHKGWFRRCIVRGGNTELPVIGFRIAGTSPQVQDGMRYLSALSSIVTKEEIEKNPRFFRVGAWMATVGASEAA